MAKPDTAERKELPKKDFGEPSQRKFPMPDASHAANAKARASEEEHKGKLSESEKEKIDGKANRILGRKKKEPDPKKPGAALLRSKE
jgi:hypothetical protein